MWITQADDITTFMMFIYIIITYILLYMYKLYVYRRMVWRGREEEKKRKNKRGEEKKERKKNTKDFKAWIPVFTGMTEGRGQKEKRIQIQRIKYRRLKAWIPAGVYPREDGNGNDREERIRRKIHIYEVSL